MNSYVQCSRQLFIGGYAIVQPATAQSAGPLHLPSDHNLRGWRRNNVPLLSISRTITVGSGISVNVALGLAVAFTEKINFDVLFEITSQVSPGELNTLTKPDALVSNEMVAPLGMASVLKMVVSRLQLSPTQETSEGLKPLMSGLPPGFLETIPLWLCNGCGVTPDTSTTTTSITYPTVPNPVAGVLRAAVKLNWVSKKISTPEFCVGSLIKKTPRDRPPRLISLLKAVAGGVSGHGEVNNVLIHRRRVAL